MPKTVAALAEELATELGEQYGDADVTRQFDAWVSEVVESILAAEKWPFQVGAVELSTADEVRVYELGEKHGDIVLIQKSGVADALDYVSREDLVEKGVNLLEAGEPRAWYYDELTDDSNLAVGFWPVPDGVYTYQVQRERLPGQLDEDSTTTNIPLPVDFLLVVREGVRGHYRESVGDSSGATAAWSRFTAKLRALRTRYLTPRSRRSVMQVSDIPLVPSFSTPRWPSGY